MMADDLNLEAAFAQLLANAARAMHDAVQDGPAAVSQDRVPKETGDLAATMQVSEPVIEGDTATVTVSYGNPDDQTGIYAVVQHERTDFAHPGGGQAKYLESAVLESAQGFGGEIAAKMGR
jgi:hypothetical protein